MDNEEQMGGAVEEPWAFEIGQEVSIDFEPGEVTWRRENTAGQRDYLVKTAAGEAWHPEADLKAA